MGVIKTSSAQEQALPTKWENSFFNTEVVSNELQCVWPKLRVFSSWCHRVLKEVQPCSDEPSVLELSCRISSEWQEQMGWFLAPRTDPFQEAWVCERAFQRLPSYSRRHRRKVMASFPQNSSISFIHAMPHYYRECTQRAESSFRFRTI